MLLPGRPRSVPSALTTGEWNRKRIIAYISNTSLVILSAFNKLLQTIYHDGQLSAVAFCEATGKLAVASGSSVFIYRPNPRNDGLVDWSLQDTIFLPPSDGNASALSWGAPDELLIGSSALILWSTERTHLRLLWRQDLPNPAKLVLFSPDASLIASISDRDRLVKVWRRATSGSEEIRFDFSYLPHPRAVTNLHWRKPAHAEESNENVLYTFAADQVVRIWAPVYPHDAHLLQLWTMVDLKETSPLKAELDMRYAYVIDSGALEGAAACAVGAAGETNKNKGAIQHLIEIANRGPEIIIGFDAEGRMSAWGLENVGCKSRRTTNVFSIMTDEPSGIRAFRRGCEAGITFHGFVTDGSLVLLAHFLDGRIHWLESRVDRMLDPGVRTRRFSERAVWTGHSGPIKRMIRTADGRILCTGTNDNELYIWSVEDTPDGQSLRARSLLKSDDRVRRTAILDNGRFIITLHEHHIALWDARGRSAFLLQRLQFKSKARPLCLLLLPESVNGSHHYHVALVDRSMNGIAWSVRPPSSSTSRSHHQNGIYTNEITPYLKQISEFTLEGAEDEGVLAMFPVEPVGYNATLSDSLDVFSREVATTVCASGLLISWTVKVYDLPTGGEVKWLATSRFETGVRNPSYAKSSSVRKIAMVDETKRELTIWDSRAGILEYKESFDDNINDLDWTSTPDDQSILSVGFPHRVLLMSQLRYDYLNAGPAWAPFREINIKRITPHPIGDSTWLHDGGLVIGTGNQLFVYPRKIEEVDEVLDSLHLSHHQTKLDDIFQIVSELNGPLPVYHPQFMQQAMLCGKSSLAENIAVRLYKELRNYHEEIGLDRYLDIPLSDFLDPHHEPAASKPPVSRQRSYFDHHSDDDDDPDSFSPDTAYKLCDLLKTTAVPHLTGTDQINLTGIIESMAEVQQHRRSIDEIGAQFFLFFRQNALQNSRSRSQQYQLSFREFVWAFHSNSQDILVDLVNRAAPGSDKLLWPQAKNSGLFVWLSDEERVRRELEVLARNHYTRTPQRDPIECSLYYLALRKKKVLAGLWRVAGGHKEQAAMIKFLANNFDEPRWKTAAAKNAYKLMATHRFEYAAAFFLLSDSLPDCLSILHDKLHDPHLAIAIARAYDGDRGQHFQAYLSQKLLPHAAATNDRWLATWCFWMLSQRDLAVRALLQPLDSLISPPSAPTPKPSRPGTPSSITSAGKTAKIERDAQSRFYTLSDPAVTIFYRTLRESTLSAHRGAMEAANGEREFEVVLQTARIYDRMGCDLLALELIRNWRFLEVDYGGLGKGRKRHRRRGSIIEVPDGRMRRRVSRVGINDEVEVGVKVGEEIKVVVGEGEVGGKVEEKKQEVEEDEALRLWRERNAGKMKQPEPQAWVEPDMSWAF